MLGIFLYCSPPWFLGQGLLLNPKFSDTTKLSESSWLHLPSTRITGVHHYTQFFIWVLSI